MSGEDMDLKKLEETLILFDYYKNLLSEKQQKYIEEHFEKDYSLSEIAENYGISRQAVSDNIKRTLNILKKYEKKLGFFKRDQLLKNKLEKAIKNKNFELVIETIQLLET